MLTFFKIGIQDLNLFFFLKSGAFGAILARKPEVKSFEGWRIFCQDGFPALRE
jgi:hypothetical protein